MTSVHFVLGEPPILTMANATATVKPAAQDYTEFVENAIKTCQSKGGRVAFPKNHRDFVSMELLLHTHTVLLSTCFKDF
jgi:hypothetical protein